MPLLSNKEPFKALAKNTKVNKAKVKNIKAKLSFNLLSLSLLTKDEESSKEDYPNIS